MASVSASRIKQETLCTQFTGLWGRSWSKSAYWILWSLSFYRPTGQIFLLLILKKVYFFSDRYKTLPNRFFYNKNILLDILVRMDMIIGSRENNNRILTMGSGGHFENCLWWLLAPALRCLPWSFSIGRDLTTRIRSEIFYYKSCKRLYMAGLWSIGTIFFI